MKSLLFFLFIAFMLAAGGLWLRVRARRLAEENAARSEARAQLLGFEAARNRAARDGAADVAAAAAVAPAEAAHTAMAMRSATSTTLAASLAATTPRTDARPADRPRAPQSVSAPTPQTGTPQATAARAASPAAAESGPPSARRLRRIRRSRFARVGVAYFELMGFRAQRFGRRGDADAPIDMLLFMGESKVPAMALRWSRSEGERATRNELQAFAEACAKLRIARSTFIAQHGIDDDAAEYAISRGVASLDADTLALKLAEVDARHHAHLQAIAHGAQ